MDMDMESHLKAGYCAATGTYHSRHPPLAAATAASFADYLFQRLQAFPPDRPAFIDASTGGTLSFADLRALSLKAAGALAALGLRRGHVVLLLSPNSLHFPVLSLGVLSLGAVLSTANPLLTPDELADQARDSEPFLVLAAADLAPKLRSLTSRVVVIDKLLSDINEHDAWACADPGIGRDDPALLFYSSGTTGRSKGVVTTHGNAIAMAASLERVRGRDDDDDGVGVDVYGCVLPLFHMFGFSAFVLGTPAMGATAVMVPGRFSVDKLMAAVEDCGVTTLLAVPPMVVQMAKAAAAGEPSPSSTTSARRLRLREVLSSGAPLQREHMARFRSCFLRVSLGQQAGIVTMCDMPPLLHDDDDDDDNEEGNSSPSSILIGRLVPSTEAMIVDVESEEALRPNRAGELWIRGPSVMQGYLGNEEATATALVRRPSDPEEAGRWLRTGDLCYIDSGGFVHLVDRIKELIKYKAYQVAPAELEDLLAAHPDIQDVAVAPNPKGVPAYPDEEAGEIPVACVVRKSGSGLLQAQEVLSFVQDKVAPYKKIRKVVFVECIPRSPSGKILRAQLKSFLRTCATRGTAELQATTPI
ncbi:hypothetical protein ACP70R_022440 [Stipagrostis hirtigluma subsp. patula]